MNRKASSVPAVVLLLLVLSAACSSGGGGGSGAQTCPAGFDAGGSISGPESVNEQGQCGNLLNGTKQTGDACQQDSECTPVCCACPSGSKSSSAQVAWCNQGKCVVGAEACCAFIAAASFGADAGSLPFVCQH